MSDPVLKIDVAKWVESVKDEPDTYRQRQTVEITLNAIARTTQPKHKDVLEGRYSHGARLRQSEADVRH